jgi:hypothetical protein
MEEEKFGSEIYLKINSIWNKEELRNGSGRLFYLSIRRVRKYFIVIKDAEDNIWA